MARTFDTTTIIVTEQPAAKWSAKDAFKSLRPEADRTEEEIAELECIHKEQEAEKHNQLETSHDCKI